MDKRELKECFMELAKNANLAACATGDESLVSYFVRKKSKRVVVKALTDSLFFFVFAYGVIQFLFLY